MLNIIKCTQDSNLELFLWKLDIDFINATFETCEDHYLCRHLQVKCNCHMCMLQNGATVSMQ